MKGRKLTREEREIMIEFGGDRAARLIAEGEYRCRHCGATECDEATCKERPKRRGLRRFSGVTAQQSDTPMRKIPNGRTTAGVEPPCSGDP
jgi:hypothetical protein